jgi:hypothetical protein
MFKPVYIPIGKAIIPVIVERRVCSECSFYGVGCFNIACSSSEREDGEAVIFKTVDFPEEFLV